VKSAKTRSRIPRKPRAAVKGAVVRLRLTESLRHVATTAATKDGHDLSSWLRWLIARRAAELGVATTDVPEET
jgi:transposase-like protein